MRSLWRISSRWLDTTRLPAHMYPTNILRIKNLIELIWWTSSIPCTLNTWSKFSTMLQNKDLEKSIRMIRNKKFWPQTNGWVSYLSSHFIPVRKFLSMNSHNICCRKKWKDCALAKAMFKAQSIELEEKEVRSHGIFATIQGASKNWRYRGFVNHSEQQFKCVGGWWVHRVNPIEQKLILVLSKVIWLSIIFYVE